MTKTTEKETKKEEPNFVSQEELQGLGQALNKKYEVFIMGKGQQFFITAANNKGLVEVKVLLKNENESFFYPVEARVDSLLEEFKTPRKAALFLIDYVDLYFEDYFEEAGELLLPIDWAKYEYEAVNFEMRGQIFNLYLDRMADALLEANPEGERH